MRTRILGLAPLGLGAASALACMTLAACDGSPSAIPARPHGAADTADRRLADATPDGTAARRSSDAGGAPRSASAGTTPLFHGRPIWAANKDHSGQENADYHFRRDAAVFGSKTEDDFLTRVHDFIDHPPKGVLTLTRANGDRLMYDPKANIFAVADKDGAPRTLFKPTDGQAYWDKQKDALARGDDYGGARTTTRRTSGSNDNG